VSYRFALCSEVYRLPIEETIRRAAEIGYEGLEIAPFNVAESVVDVTPRRRRQIREIARDHGISIVGLHWLLLSPKGLHLTTADAAVRRRTSDYLIALVHFCADLEGEVLVLGSPRQRDLEPGTESRAAVERAVDVLRPAADAAASRGVKLLLEPLHPRETTFLRSVEEALELVAAIDRRGVGYILDCKAMSGMPDGIEGTLRRYGAEAAHVHMNCPDGKGPGMGELDFGPVFVALRESRYQGWVSTEPFDYTPDSDTVARTALDTLRRAAQRAT
jgi:sugar phosphate isomerase/epimerase